jgi:hypothetical protein
MRGFFRQHRYDIRYLPGADGTGTDEVADVLTALSKHIDSDNQTKAKDGEVWDDGIVTGRGYMDIRLDFSRNVLGEVRERVLDNFAVYPDPEGDTVDTETWGHVHHRRWLSLDDIKLIYGGIAAESLQEQSSGGPAGRQHGYPVRFRATRCLRRGFFAGWDPFDDPTHPSTARQTCRSTISSTSIASW